MSHGHDSLHDPANWRRCSRWGVDSPVDYDECHNCGREFETVRAAWGEV